LNLPIPTLVYKPLITLESWSSGARFFAEPTIENYGPQFLKIGELSGLRRWIVMAYGEERRIYFIAVTLLFALVTPLQTLQWPFRKLFWFLRYQMRRRILKAST
jgi:hypothetical protein